jgi:hypothetical protein
MATGSRDVPGARDGTHCGRCGQLMAERDHSACSAQLALEPPRFCAECGRRMKVQVAPRGWTATCVEHGVRTG